MLSDEDFARIVKLVCPHCRAGHLAHKRTDTGEWVHDRATGGQFTHTICWADGLRRSDMAPPS